MSRRRSDESFAAFAAGQRSRLSSAAGLLGATPGQADELVEWALATTYPRWSGAERPDLEVVRLVLQSDPGVVEVPWRRRARVDLLDAAPAPTLAAIPAALQRLSRQQRIVLVGRAYLRLDDAELAVVTGLGAEQLDVLDRDARRIVGSADLGPRLAAAAAALSTVAPSAGAADDLAHGRWVLRRRRLRLLSAAAAVLVVIALLVVQLRPTPAPESAPFLDPGPSPSSASPSAVACRTSEVRCQVQRTREWRGETAALVATALDPDGKYFTGGFSYAYDDLYDGYWENSDGALGFSLLARDGSATQVFVQVATSRTSAVRCGRLTDHVCERQKFLDGNWFTLTDSVDVRHGMEVQYRPDGDQVITLVARNTTKGHALEIGRGDLITLIQDPRLRLPPR